jgi:hypothetical protein
MSSRRTGATTRRPFGTSRRTPAAAILAAAASFLIGVATASGHEGGPRLILDPSQVNPGGVVLVRGEDLGLDEPMQLSLVGETGRVDLAAVSTDGEGHFTVAVEIPQDISTGTYAIETSLASGGQIRSLVRVDGVAVQPEQGGAPPGQDEGFPAPGAIATTPPVAAPGASAVSAVPDGSTLRPLPDPASAFDPVPFVALAGAIGALGLLVWRTRRPPTVTTGSADSP